MFAGWFTLQRSVCDPVVGELVFSKVGRYCSLLNFIYFVCASCCRLFVAPRMLYVNYVSKVWVLHEC